MTNSMDFHPELELSFSKLAIDLSNHGNDQHDEDCPSNYLCPVTGNILVDPVLVRAECNHTVSRACFQDWLAHGNKSCPCCQAPLKALYAKTNKDLKTQVQTYQLHRSQMTLDASFSLLNDDAGMKESSHTTSSSRSKRERRVALKVKPALQEEIQAHGRPQLQDLEKEASHSTIETMDMSFSWRLDRGSNWEESCSNIDNIRTHTRRAPSSPTKGMVYKVGNPRPRGNSPPQRNRPMQRLLHAMTNHTTTTAKNNHTIKARPPTTLRLPFGTPLNMTGNGKKKESK